MKQLALVRAFCADAGGHIVWSAAATSPAVRDGRCDTTAAILR